MHKSIAIYLLFIFISFFTFSKVQAFEIESYNDSYIYVLDNDQCSTVFDEDTLDFLQQIFDIFKFLAPLLCISLSVVDFIKAAASQDKELLLKASKTALKRVILAAILFFIPTLINYFFDLVGWTGTCGIQ